jgi:arginine/ornithine transport system substrate-binding protein
MGMWRVTTAVSRLCERHIHEKTAQDKELKVAIDPTYEPFTFKTADGKPTGFDVDIANAVCEHIKRKCVFVEQVWDSMIPGLQAKKYDTIISSMSITEDRLKVVDFTDKYYNTPSKIVVKNDIKFTPARPRSRARRSACSRAAPRRNTPTANSRRLGVIVTPYEAQDQVYLDIKSGRLDGTVADVLEVTGGFLSKPEGKDYG